MKKCRSCNKEKELEEFYKHPQMPDGHLNFCKECKRATAREYWVSGNYKENDKRRQGTEKRREWQRKQSARMRIKHKEKRTCHSRFWNKFRQGLIEKTPCEVCGATERVEAHHSDYNKPFDVMWLCSKHHKEWHRNNEYIDVDNT
jgi:hypothetical protein